MYSLTKKALCFLIVLCISSINVMAMEVEDDPMGEEEVAVMGGGAEHPALWEQNLRRAAESYDTPYEDFKREALAFLESYKQTNPTSNVGLEDLIITEKPDPSILANAIAKYRQAYPGTTQEEIDEFMTLFQPSPKFSIPE